MRSPTLPPGSHRRPSAPPRERIERWVAELVLRRPVAIVAVAVLLAVAGGAIAWRGLLLDADTNSLIAADRPFMRLYRDFLDEFGDLEYLYVVVDSRPGGVDDVDGARGEIAERAVDDLIKRLQAIESLPAVHGRIEPREQLHLATRSMPIEALADLAAAERTLPALARGDAAAVLRRSTEDLERLLRVGVLLDDTERNTLATGALLALGTIADTRSGLDAPPPPRHLASESGRMRFVAILPDKRFNQLAVIEAPLRAIRAAIAQTQALFPQVEIGLTGKPVLQADELATTDRDMRRAATVAVVAIALLFMAVFRGWRRPLLAVAAFALAFGWTYGFATLAVGRLNLLSIVFMLVLVGVGLDYGIHVVARFMEARRRRIAAGALRTVMRTAAPANLTGGVTSAAVFLLALLTGFQGLRELGVIAGVGLLFCVLAMSTVLPALLYLTERRRRRDPRPRPAPDATEPSVHPHHPSRRLDWLLVTLPAALAIAGLAVAVAGLRFERNLLKLQAADLDSVEWEHRVFEDAASASWFGAVIAESPEDAERIAELASAMPEIAGTRSLIDLVPVESPEVAARRLTLRRAVTAAAAEPGPGERLDSPAWEVSELARASGLLDRLATAATARHPEEASGISEVAAALASLAETAKQDPSGVRRLVERRVGAAEETLGAILEGDRLPLRAALPAALRDELVAPSGRLLVKVMPVEDLWSAEPLGSFVAALRALDPDATGVPMTQLESIRDMTRAFGQLLLLSFVAVAFFVWVDLRSVGATLVCVATLAMGLSWTVGAMSLLGIPLNLANFFAIPILAGLGIDSSVHMVHRAMEQRGRHIRYGATARAVVLSATTTSLGFGMLLFASHRGLQSLGQVMLIGSLCCMVAAVVALPALLRRLGWERR